jgi:coenzyme F420-reducing hydrogenase gamma subunit
LARSNFRVPRHSVKSRREVKPLALLGGLRPTLDIDYDVKGTPEDMAELQKVIEKLAAEQKLELEYVPIEEFIPLPESARSRHRLIGRFGELAVYVYDPYSIALSKVARGCGANPAMLGS